MNNIEVQHMIKEALLQEASSNKKNVSDASEWKQAYYHPELGIIRKDNGEWNHYTHSNRRKPTNKSGKAVHELIKHAKKFRKK